MSAHSVLLAPVVSEKSYALMENGCYVFRCDPRATKVEIKNDVEHKFSTEKERIKVIAVHTLRMGGKVRRRSRSGVKQRVIGRSRHWKKAIVQLAPGQKIANLKAEGV